MPVRPGNGTGRLGDILVERKLVTQDNLERALSYQKESGSRLGEALIKLGYISDIHLAEALAAQKKLPIIALGEVFPNPRAASLLTEKFIRARRVMPVDFNQDALILAMVDPLDVVTLDDVRVITGLEVEPVVATASGFADTLEYVFSGRGVLDASERDEPRDSRQVAEERRNA
ncbi:MAG TPA: type II secretion system protein GspE, partial [Thermoleophilia bacterium]|nr:type II secretion system protein GspE [Thermoleophilia bacterium]